MPLTPHEILWLLVILIWIDGLALCGCILWKGKPKGKGAMAIKAKVQPKVDSLADMQYTDPFARR